MAKPRIRFDLRKPKARVRRNRKPPIPPSKAFGSDADYRRSSERDDIRSRRDDEDDFRPE